MTKVASKIVIDLDNTLTCPENKPYSDLLPNYEVLETLRSYKAAGFEICIFTARNMRTHESSVGKINAHTLPIIIDWLQQHGIPYDEIHVGKPWCGPHGFYVDDKAIRPDEFIKLSHDEIMKLTGEEGQ